ncbi:uncharacterized protein PV06_05513 [Exophiala oligosperma]|uniref:Uncharacterized protein n=1 Tax=Exophiala oligosperma TaxID=215243 RepID=A0A0D2BWQ9_9EURO|nr:uncharacterized protein PV06_05513 [Exophiala oligosperma]KIW41917.1 hypothetical protein PV06_05513 [Exophiala oligosperma]
MTTTTIHVPLVAEEVDLGNPLRNTTHAQPGGFEHQSGKIDHLDARWFVVSPYPEPEHMLDLQSIDTPNRLLALALTTLAPATKEYATTTYQDAINWRDVMTRLKSLVREQGYTWTSQEFYVVDFRSKLMEDIDSELLFKLDKFSHVEATQSGGLLKYWYGTPDGNRRNLATCVWRNKNDAIKGGTGPWHQQARAIIPRMYEHIDVRGVRLIIEDDVASWTFAPY